MSFFRPASIWQASDPLPTRREALHPLRNTEDDTPAHDGGRVMGVLSGAEQAQWEEDGWCLVRGLLPPETIAAAQAVLPTLVPTAEEFADNVDPARNEPFRVDSHRVMPRFPFEDGALNDIVVHDRIIDLAEQLLGLTDTDLRLYQAMLSAKYGEGALSDEQLLHVDFGNHTLVVPRHEPGYQQLEMFVYLSDVTAETGATRVVSRRLTPDIQVERTYLSQTDYAELYAAEVPACGAGRIDPGLSPRRLPPRGPHDGAPVGAVHGARLVQTGRHRLAGIARIARRCRRHVVVPVRAARRCSASSPCSGSRRRAIPTGPRRR